MPSVTERTAVSAHSPVSVAVFALPAAQLGNEQIISFPNLRLEPEYVCEEKRT
jgi:hypothetical protein